MTDICVSMDNEFMGATSLENKAILWRLKTMRQVHSYSGHKDTVSACKFSFSRKSLFTGSLDRTIKFWDLDKGICTRTVSKNVYFTRDFLEYMHVIMF